MTLARVLALGLALTVALAESARAVSSATAGAGHHPVRPPGQREAGPPSDRALPTSWSRSAIRARRPIRSRRLRRRRHRALGRQPHLVVRFHKDLPAGCAVASR
jgi:hypothetical protein